MRIEYGTMALIAITSVAEVTSKPQLRQEPPSNGWPGQDLVPVVTDSQVMNKYNYTTCRDKLPQKLKGKLPEDQRACFFPQDNNTIHFVPNIDHLAPLLTNPNIVLNANDSSLSSIVFVLDEDERERPNYIIEGVQTWVHPLGEKKFINGDPQRHANNVTGEILTEATGLDVNSTNAADAAWNCGPNAAGDGSGKNFNENVNGYEISVVEGAKNKPEFAIFNISNKDCYIYVSKPSSTPTSPKPSKSSSASTLSLERMGKVAGAGAMAIAIYNNI